MDATTLRQYATKGISVSIREETTRFDKISSVRVALAASIHVGNIVQAERMSSVFEIVSAACLALLMFKYDGVKGPVTGLHAWY
jgi:hypothetical protein